MSVFCFPGHHQAFVAAVELAYGLGGSEGLEAATFVPISMPVFGSARDGGCLLLHDDFNAQFEEWPDCQDVYLVGIPLERQFEKATADFLLQIITHRHLIRGILTSRDLLPDHIDYGDWDRVLDGAGVEHRCLRFPMCTLANNLWQSLNLALLDEHRERGGRESRRRRSILTMSEAEVAHAGFGDLMILVFCLPVEEDKIAAAGKLAKILIRSGEPVFSELLEKCKIDANLEGGDDRFGPVYSY